MKLNATAPTPVIKKATAANALLTIEDSENCLLVISIRKLKKHMTGALRHFLARRRPNSLVQIHCISPK